MGNNSATSRSCDGSGVYVPVDGNRTISFFLNGTVAVNGTMCSMTTDVGPETEGSYTALSGIASIDGEIVPNECTDVIIYYSVDGATLYLLYQCIYSCGQKLKKVE